MRHILIAAVAALLIAGPAFAQDAEPDPLAPSGTPTPAPQVLVVKSSAVIAAPRVLEVDSSVICQINGDVLSCTAARPAE